MKYSKYLFIGLGTAGVLCCFALISSFVWIPDISGRTVVLADLKTTNGDRMQITQVFVGDGYLTRFTHTNKVNREWELVVDGDARKAWKAKLEQTSSNTFDVEILGQTFSYNLTSHFIFDQAGRQQSTLEIPENGSKPFFVGKDYNFDGSKRTGTNYPQ